MNSPENYNPQTLEQIEQDFPNRSYTAVHSESSLKTRDKKYQVIAVLDDPITKMNQGLFSKQLGESEYFDLILDADDELADSLLKERHISALPLTNLELVAS